MKSKSWQLSWQHAALAVTSCVLLLFAVGPWFWYGDSCGSSLADPAMMVFWGLALMLAVPTLVLVTLLRLILQTAAWREVGWTAMLIALAVGGTMVSSKVGQRVRDARLAQHVERLDATVAAIRGYEAKHGRAPSDLSQLVPEFAPTTPTSGMCRFSLDYSAASSGTWRLTVWLSEGMTPSTLSFASDGGHLYGSEVHEIGNWALETVH